MRERREEDGCESSLRLFVAFAPFIGYLQVSC